MLALASVPLGLVLAVAGTRLIWAQIPPGRIPYYVQWRVDARSLAYAIAVAVSTALVFGLVPALQITRRELQENLKEGARGSTGRGALVRNALVVAQVSLALVALVGALLFVRSFRNLDGFRVGLRHDIRLDAALLHERRALRAEGRKARRVEDIVRRVEALPGVQAAFASNLVRSGRRRRRRRSRSKAGATTNQRPTISASRGDAARATGRSACACGRAATSPSRIRPVRSPSSTRRWPDACGRNEIPIDRRFRLWTENGSREWLTVIGVAPDLHLFGIDPEQLAGARRSRSRPTRTASSPTPD